MLLPLESRPSITVSIKKSLYPNSFPPSLLPPPPLFTHSAPVVHVVHSPSMICLPPPPSQFIFTHRRISVKCFAQDAEHSVEFLSDILLNSNMERVMVCVHLKLRGREEILKGKIPEVLVSRGNL